MKGFSLLVTAFAQAWPDVQFVQGVLAQSPWYQQLALLDKLDSSEDRQWYAHRAIEHNWSRNVLVIQIETRLKARTSAAQTNFETSLPTIEQIEQELANSGNDEPE